MLINDVLIPRALVRDTSGFDGRIEGDCLRGDLEIRDGRAMSLHAAHLTRSPRMVLPALVEAHCHLDKCHSGYRMQAVGGDLATAIAAQFDDKRHWTETDLRDRAGRGLREAMLAGCGTLRTHIDWGAEKTAPLSWSVLTELAADCATMRVQCAALTGLDQMADPTFCTAVARQVAVSGGVLGSFVLHHTRVRQGLHCLFDAATRFGLALDFHVDEALGDYNGLEAICDKALETGFEGPILCGHAVSLIDRDMDSFKRLAAKLVKAGISICALPTTNLYLQGRSQGTPDRRGITRLKELRDAGVPVVIGSDNVSDAFCPAGQHDPMAALHLAVLAAHLDPPLDRWLTCVTTDAAIALGLPAAHVDGAHLTDLRITDAATTGDLIAGRAPLQSLIPQTERV
jgi:cytosine deaminase